VSTPASEAQLMTKYPSVESVVLEDSDISAAHTGALVNKSINQNKILHICALCLERISPPVAYLQDSYLYKKYKIDSLQLVQSEEYYIKNPRIYYRIYSKVISQLQKSKDSIDTLFNNREKDTQ